MSIKVCTQVTKALVGRVDLHRLLVLECYLDDWSLRRIGEEFAVYLTGVTRQQLLMVAERIRSNVVEIRFNPDGTRLWPLSVSIGVTMDTHMDEMGHMLKRADLALFDAKKGGKNRVSYCRPEASAMVA